MIKDFGRLWDVQPSGELPYGGASGRMVTNANRGVSSLVLSLCLLAVVCSGAARAAEVKEGFVTVTFGKGPSAQHPETLSLEQDNMHFDLRTLPKGIEIQPAILRFPFRSDWGGHSPAKLLPVGISDKCLPTRAPDHRTLDGTQAVRVWVADNTGRWLFPRPAPHGFSCAFPRSCYPSFCSLEMSP